MRARQPTSLLLHVIRFKGGKLNSHSAKNTDQGPRYITRPLARPEQLAEIDEIHAVYLVMRCDKFPDHCLDRIAI